MNKPEGPRRQTEASVGAPLGNAALELVVVSGDKLRVFELPRAGSAAIGRAADNAIVIDHDSVSRWHAALHMAGTLVIEDLAAANGTFVPDRTHSTEPGQTQHLRRLVRESAELAVGDNVMLGGVSAVVRRIARRAASDSFADEASGAVILDAQMLRLYAEATRAAPAAISVLILGETGVGKEVLAREIHARSPRAKHPFLGINCATLGETLVEGELFGYERGAFTGAVESRPGLFEAAERGTVFLDEIGELAPATQAKLLRVLEERVVMRLGARKPCHIDVRFLSATNRDLAQQVLAGAFRQDLFYRLNGLTLTLPPLRERPAELEPLVHRFLAAACEQLDRRLLTVSDEAMRLLAAYSWPGNVRELKNVIERAAVLCAADVVRPEHLPSAFPAQPQAHTPTESGGASTNTRATAPPELDPTRFAAQITTLERARIVQALSETGGNQTEAAKLLGMARRTLISRLEELDVPRPRKRPRQ